MAAKQILVAAGVLHGATCKAYSALQPDIEAAGGSWHAVAASFDNGHSRGTLDRAPAWPAHPECMRQLLAVFGSRIAPKRAPLQRPA